MLIVIHYSITRKLKMSNKMFDLSKQKMTVFARQFGELLVHCQFFHLLVVDAIGVGSSNCYSLKLAHFVKQCADLGLHYRIKSIVKHAKHLLRDVLDLVCLVWWCLYCSLLICK
jgi:hypothetical protein